MITPLNMSVTASQLLVLLEKQEEFTEDEFQLIELLSAGLIEQMDYYLNNSYYNSVVRAEV